MFGKGIYFAKTPLKSKQYTGWLGCLVLCEVELGNSKMERAAKKDLNPDVYLGCGAANGDQTYDSITAKDGPDGCVRVPEYVIYNPKQAVPRYLFFVKQVLRLNDVSDSAPSALDLANEEAKRRRIFAYSCSSIEQKD